MLGTVSLIWALNAFPLFESHIHGYLLFASCRPLSVWGPKEQGLPGCMCASEVSWPCYSLKL